MVERFRNNNIIFCIIQAVLLVGKILMAKSASDKQMGGKNQFMNEETLFS